MARKTITLIVVVALLFIGAVFVLQVAKEITHDITQEITQKEIARVTQEQTEGLTKQETERITEEIIRQRTADITEGIIGWVKQKEKEPCNLPTNARAYNVEPYYTGPWIDSHVHMPVSSQIVSTVADQAGLLNMAAFDDELNIDYLICLFDSEGITKTIGFYLAPTPVFSSSIRMVKNIEERYPGKIVAFYMPTPLPSYNPPPAEVQEIIDENKELFHGIGEVKFAYYTIPNDKPEDPQYLKLYQIANDGKLVVMMHPAVDHKDEVESFLKRYPQAIFFLHGESEAWVFDLMEKYSNLYFQIGHEIHTFGTTREHIQRAFTKEEWLTYFKPRFQESLDAEVQKWKPIIAKHPDRLTVGTDRWYPWHFDADAGALMEEFERSFLGQFEPEVQEKLAWKNAEKLLQER